MQNSFLCVDFNEEEVKMRSGLATRRKVQALDIYSFIFFKSNWDLLKFEVMRMMSDFH